MSSSELRRGRGADESGRPEQRRSRRYACALDVDLSERQATRRVRTIDVARHGLFIAAAEPPHDRHLVQLVIHVHQRPIRVAAHVTRRVPGLGFGVQLFALAADDKQVWDAFLVRLSKGAARTRGDASAEGNVVASTSTNSTFLIRLREPERLAAYAREHVAAGGTVVFTPVLLDPGAPVTLTLVHPRTEEEFPLHGVVVRAHTTRPKRLEIVFTDRSDHTRARLERFIETGVPPTSPPAPIGSLAAAAATMLPAGDVLTDPSVLSLVDSLLDIDVAADAFDADIEIDDGGPIDWSARPESDDGAIARAIAASSSQPPRAASHITGLPMPADAPFLRHASPSGSHASSLPTRAAAAAGLGSAAVFEVDCDGIGCSASTYFVALGPCAEPLGLVADLVPFWSASQGRIVAAPRFVQDDEREARVARFVASGGSLEAAVPLSLLLSTARLYDAPVDVDGAPLRTTRAVERIAATARNLGHIGMVGATKVRCPHCEDGHLVLERTT